MSVSIAIVDYDAGNLRNVEKAFEQVGCHPIIARCGEELERADVIVLPGVGSFQDGMGELERLGLDEVIRFEVLEKRKPLLGICLGMQLLASEGAEGGPRKGLGILPMTVRRLDAEEYGLRLPHIGWNDVAARGGSALFRGIAPQPDFYFVHSYHCVCEDPQLVAATAVYGRTFTAAVETENVFATQFHPEKSQRYGLKLLENFVRWCEMAGAESRRRVVAC